MVTTHSLTFFVFGCYNVTGNDETEMKLEVKQEDFELALKELVPSVSFEELERYERLQSEFQKPNLENT